MAELVEEHFEFGRADEVLREFAADQSVLFVNKVPRTIGIEETFHFVAVDFHAPSSRNGSHLDAVFETQIAEHFLEWQVR